MADARRTRAYSRRALLRVAFGAAGIAALAACGGESATPTTGSQPAAPAGGGTTPSATATAAGAARATTTTTTVAGTARTTTPSTTRAGTPATEGSPIAADGKLPGGPGVPDAYLKPPPVFQSVRGAPGKGSTVSVFTLSYQAPVPPRDQNRHWQELEKRLGVKSLNVTFAPASAYAEKLSAITAGGDLPDLTFVHLGLAPDQYKAIFQGAYTDLTPYLSGDALKDYPNLAAFEPRLWRNVAIKGKIYGAPKPRFNISGSINLRQDWAEKLGRPLPRNADEFFQLLQAFTGNDPDGNGQADTWGIGSQGPDLFCQRSLSTMFRVPNGWRKNPDGSLVNALETEEFRATVAYQRQLQEAGIFYPESATQSPQQGNDNYVNGKYGTFQNALTALYGRDGRRAKILEHTPGAKPIAFVLPGHDGGQGVAYMESGYYGMVAIPAKVGRDKERVRELLHILDYYAAPFGSAEEVFLDAGLEGLHHTVQPNGSRVLTDLGEKEIGDLNYMINGPVVFYYPETPGDAQDIQGVTRRLVAIGLDNPTEGLYSPTDAQKASELNQLRRDRLTAIILGREPFSAFDQYVKDWRSRGGDQIRQEYEQALKEQG
jgi:putative aldouronate transport system substrate-binding protein